MSRVEPQLFAWMASDFAFSTTAFAEARGAFRVEAEESPMATGVGSLQQGLAVVRRRPALAAQAFDFAALATDTPSRVAFGVAGAPGARLGTQDVPPFRYQNRLIAIPPAPRGTLEPTARRALVDALPDALRRARDGESDGELIALTHLSGLVLSSAIRSPELDPEDCRAALVEARSRIVATTSAVPEALVSNGRLLFVFAGARRFFWKVLRSLNDDLAHNVDRRQLGLPYRAVARPDFRALFVSTLEGAADDWQTLEAGDTLAADGTRPDFGVRIDG